jgi:hypothetical protein
MDIPAGDEVAAPWGINPANGRPWTKSPEERAAIGAQLAAARARKAAARQAEAAAEAPAPEDLTPIDRTAPDREPGAQPRRRPGRRRGGARAAGEPKPTEPVPPFRAGPIAKGMNRIYAKAGRLVKMANPMLGEALISMTRKESDDDETVGEAWEALAQVSPVWRARLLKLVTGGAAGRVLLAHAPILLALLMLEPVQKRMPFGRFVEVLFGGDDEPAATSAATAEPDLAQMMQMATEMMGPLMMQRAANAGSFAVRVPIPEEMQPPAPAEAAA